MSAKETLSYISLGLLGVSVAGLFVLAGKLMLHRDIFSQPEQKTPIVETAPAVETPLSKLPPATRERMEKVLESPKGTYPSQEEIEAKRNAKAREMLAVYEPGLKALQELSKGKFKYEIDESDFEKGAHPLLFTIKTNIVANGREVKLHVDPNGLNMGSKYFCSLRNEANNLIGTPDGVIEAITAEAFNQGMIPAPESRNGKASVVPDAKL